MLWKSWFSPEQTPDRRAEDRIRLFQAVSGCFLFVEQQQVTDLEARVRPMHPTDIRPTCWEVPEEPSDCGRSDVSWRDPEHDL